MSVTAGLGAFAWTAGTADDIELANLVDDAPRRLDLEIPRWWHAIAEVTSDSQTRLPLDSVTDPCNPILGGRLVTRDGDDDALHLYTPDDVVCASNRLASGLVADRFARLDPDRFERDDVYPGGWNEIDSTRLWAEELAPLLVLLQEFYAAASTERLAVAVELF